MEILARLTFLEMSNPAWLMLRRNWRTFLKLTLCISLAKDVVRHPVVAEIIRAYEPIPNPVVKEKMDVEEEAE